MQVLLNGQEYYQVREALEAVGISRATYFRWVRQARTPDTNQKDRNGRRLFTAEEVERLRRIAQHVIRGQDRLPILWSETPE